jgi:hypothetical protein
MKVVIEDDDGDMATYETWEVAKVTITDDDSEAVVTDTQPGPEIGDIVWARHGYSPSVRALGEVVSREEGFDPGVAFFEKFGGGHDAHGKAVQGHGWFIDKGPVEVVQYKNEGG